MIREELEKLEEMILSPLAAKSSRSKGRVLLQSHVKSGRNFSETGIKFCIANPFGA